MGEGVDENFCQPVWDGDIVEAVKDTDGRVKGRFGGQGQFGGCLERKNGLFLQVHLCGFLAGDLHHSVRNVHADDFTPALGELHHHCPSSQFHHTAKLEISIQPTQQFSDVTHTHAVGDILHEQIIIAGEYGELIAFQNNAIAKKLLKP